MGSHRTLRGFDIPVADGLEYLAVLIVDDALIIRCRKRNEPKPQRPFVKFQKDIRKNSVMRGASDKPMKFPVQQHHSLDMVGHDRLVCPEQNVAYCPDSCRARPLRGEPNREY